MKGILKTIFMQIYYIGAILFLILALLSSVFVLIIAPFVYIFCICKSMYDKYTEKVESLK